MVGPNAVLQGDGYVSGKKWRHVEVRKGRIFFRNKEVESGWVRFTREFSDGYRDYQKGQVVELENKEKLMLYLEEGHCLPTEPEPIQTKDPYADEPRGLFRFTECVPTDKSVFEVGKEYELPLPRGRKYVERGLAVEVKEREVRQPKRS